MNYFLWRVLRYRHTVKYFSVNIRCRIFQIYTCNEFLFCFVFTVKVAIINEILLRFLLNKFQLWTRFCFVFTIKIKWRLSLFCFVFTQRKPLFCFVFASCFQKEDCFFCALYLLKETMCTSHVYRIISNTCYWLIVECMNTALINLIRHVYWTWTWKNDAKLLK